MSVTTTLITGGRVIDPSQRLDAVTDVWLHGDKVLHLGSRPDLRADQTINAAGKYVTPGLIDIHVHLREPGREEDETIATGAAAALAGGVTSVACMPNTEPAIDNQAAAEFVVLQAKRARQAHVFPIGAVTKGRKGEELAEIGGLVEGGAVAFTDDGTPVKSAEVMRRALEYCQMFDKPVLDHCEDLDLTKEAVMNEGEWSMRLGLRGYPSAAEEIIVARDIILAELTGGLLHILHVSTAGSVELIRRGKERGIRVSGEACPHHFLLTDECLKTYDSNYKMSPPLRTQKDIDAILTGLKDNTIEVLCTDHAPHAPEKKLRELTQAPNGIVGLETFLPLCIKGLVEPGHLTWPQLIEKMTINPARILRLPGKGSLMPGMDADVTIIDPNWEWVIEPQQFKSKSRNSPFQGWKVKGRAVTAVVHGEVRFRLEKQS
jgi:dihydroorotase